MRKKIKRIEAWTGVCLVLLLAVSLLSIDGRARAENKEPGKTDIAGVRDAPALTVRKEKLSYALGMLLGNQFRDRSIEVELDLYIRGLKDGLDGGKTLLTRTETQTAVNDLERELRKKRNSPQTAATLTEINISFKLDPRLTRAQYMGDRWVSPPIFTSTLQMGTELTVQARAKGLDGGGRLMAITPEWIPSDPGMVTVSPDRGGEVKIIVKRAGESRLKVVSQDLTRELRIKAMDRGNAMQVEISR